jgi:hypothetical protein
MPSKAAVFVVVSFLLVTLIFGTSASAKPIKKGPIHCGGYGENSATPAQQITCCQEFTYSNGVTKTYCTACDNTQPP